MKLIIIVQVLVIMSINAVVTQSKGPTLGNISDRATICDFEEGGLCRWNPDAGNEAFRWSITSARSQSGSLGAGPSFDHTFGKDKIGHYMYIEGSGPRRENDTARFISPVYNRNGRMNTSDDVTCFRMWYHMNGSGTGSLKVHMKIDGKLSQLWSASGDHGDQWLPTIIHLQSTPNNKFQLVIEATRGFGFSGHFAIDDLSIQHGDNCTTPTEYNTSASYGVVPTTKIEDSTSASSGSSASDINKTQHSLDATRVVTLKSPTLWALHATTLINVPIPTTTTTVAVPSPRFTTTTKSSPTKTTSHSTKNITSPIITMPSTSETALTRLGSTSPKTIEIDPTASNPFTSTYWSAFGILANFFSLFDNTEVNTTQTSTTNPPPSPTTYTTITSTNPSQSPVTNPSQSPVNNSTVPPVTNPTSTSPLTTTAFPATLTNALAQRSKGGVGVPVAIGIAIAVMILVALVIAVVYMLYKRHSKRSDRLMEESEAILLNAAEASL